MEEVRCDVAEGQRGNLDYIQIVTSHRFCRED